MNPEPLVFLLPIELEPPTADEKTADSERLALKLAGTGFPLSEIPISVLRRLPEELRRSSFKTSAAVGAVRLPGAAFGWKLVEIGKKRIYGIAIDIGSTNIQCSLTDLSNGKKMALRSVVNPQVRFGPDVLTRVQRSIMGESSTLSEVLIEEINGLIGGTCASEGVSTDEILAVTVAGNTIESHFFLGLDVRNIPVAPYIPAVNGAIFTSASQIDLEVNENALVYLFPNSGSYVGGDIISGMLFSRIYREEKPCIFIDVGTNVEVAVGCREWIMVGAGAAGPALEGDIAGIGKRAEPGAIFRVRIDKDTGEVLTAAIPGAEPDGICGSGLIDLISEMFSAGIIDRSGVLSDNEDSVVQREGEKAYVIHSANGRELFITQSEIKNFLLSKAAMFSFLQVFVKALGLTFRDIDKVFIAGALGCGINPESAINIGMLPDLPRAKFVPLGNSSLAGAEMLLLDRNLLGDVEEIASRITYREMNEDAELMKVLQGAMFIPHTEPDVLKG